MYAKLSKCEFWLEKVTFLGHIISKDGLKVDPKKVAAVTNWGSPQNVGRFAVFWDLQVTIGDL